MADTCPRRCTSQYSWTFRKAAFFPFHKMLYLNSFHKIICPFHKMLYLDFSRKLYLGFEFSRKLYLGFDFSRKTAFVRRTLYRNFSLKRLFQRAYRPPRRREPI